MDNLNQEIKKEEVLHEEVVKKNKQSLPVAIVLSAIIISGSILLSKTIAKEDIKEDSSKLDMISEVFPEDFLRGDEKSKVTIIEYADFSCGYCGVYHPTLKRIIEEYKGEVSWVYRHLPIFNVEAAVASQCVGNLKGDTAFWNFADTLYLNRDKYSEDYYKEVALKEGILEDEYLSCIENPLIKSKIQSDLSQARILLGFNATPYSVIVDKNGREFSFAGALPYEELKSVIDKLLE